METKTPFPVTVKRETKGWPSFDVGWQLGSSRLRGLRSKDLVIDANATGQLFPYLIFSFHLKSSGATFSPQGIGGDKDVRCGRRA